MAVNCYFRQTLRLSRTGSDYTWGTSTYAHSGVASASVLAHSIYNNVVPANLSQQVPTVSGQTYVISVWTANSNGGLPVQLSVDDGNLQNQQTVSGTYPALTWQQLTINYTANSTGHVAIHLIVPYVSGNPSNLTAYFDDVRVFQGTQPSLTMNYAYDGFGNLVSKGATNGQYTTSMVVEGLTNRIVSAGGVSFGYTANGSAQPTSGSPNNYTYDILNRLTTTSQNGTKYASFAYMPGSNTRLLYSTTAGSAYLNFYGPTGQLLATYLIRPGSAPVEQARYHHLDGKALDWTEDRVGSGANYLPYGDNAPPYGPSGTNPYATYLSDPASPGLYAQQRYYNLNWGRFLTTDPLGSSARGDNPQSWNRYSYGLGDPINNSDPSGLDSTICPLEWGSCFTGPDGQSYEAPAGSLSVTSDASGVAIGINNITNYTSITVDGDSGPELSGVCAASDFICGPDGHQILGMPGAKPGIGNMDDGLGNAGIVVAGVGVEVGAAAAADAAIAAAARGVGYYAAVTGTGTGVVLGKYPAYIEAANSIGANTYNINLRLYQVLDVLGQAWTANQQFLQTSVINGGQQIFLSNPPLGQEGTFLQELEYLTSQGFGPNTWNMVPLPFHP